MRNKQRISFFFLSVLIIPVLLPVYIFLQQQVIQFSMLERLESENAQTIVLKKDAVKWIRSGKEIEVDGKPFDVKNMIADGQSFIIKGLYDGQEAQLMALSNKAKQNSQGNSPMENAFAKIATFVLFFETSKPYNFEICIVNSTSFSTLLQNGFLSFCPELVSPPPKV